VATRLVVAVVAEVPLDGTAGKKVVCIWRLPGAGINKK